MKKRFVGKRIFVLLAHKGEMPGLTRAEIRRELRLPADIEITARIREWRKRGYKIRCEKFGNDHRYYVLTRQREKMLAVAQEMVA